MPDRYNQPSQGTTNWHLPLNSNFQDLDIHVEHRGADADKSNVTHADGAKYFATDTGTIYISDGSAWNEVGTIGSGGSTEAGTGGHHTATGDGTTTTFQWVTGVSDSSNLNYVTIDASTSAASADYERFISGTDIGVTYAEPPADGEDLGWYWSVNTSVETVNGEIDAFDGAGTFLGSYTELHTGDNITGSVSNGQLTLNASGHSVEDDGTQVLTDVSDVNFGTDLGVNDDGDGSVTVNSTASSSADGEGHIVEDFETGDISEYQADTGAFNVVTGDISGSNMLQFDGSLNNNTNVIATTDTTTRRGMAYASYIRPSSGTDIAAGLVVCATISNGTVTEGYNVNIQGTGDTFALDYKTSTSAWLDNTLDTAAATINGGTLYRVEVALSPSYIDCRLINVDTATEEAQLFSDVANATALSSGGWGYYAASGASATADYDFGTQVPDTWVV